jgi:hypothetical protein
VKADGPSFLLTTILLAPNIPLVKNSRFRISIIEMTAIAKKWLVVFVILIIAAVTLRRGEGGGGARGCLICGERGLADFLSNIILFIPLGAAIAFRKGRLWQAFVLSVLLSIVVELAQWRIIAGRDANPGDLLANVTGGLVGWIAARARPWRPIAHGANVRAYATALLTTALLLGALTLFTPALWRSTYYLHWTPAYKNLERYEGAVLATRLGPLEWLEGPHSPMEPPGIVGEQLQRAPLHVKFVTGESTTSLAPIISISDEWQEEVLLIGVEGTDVVYRFNSRANSLRLHDRNVRLPDAFSKLQPGDTAELAAKFDPQELCVSVDNNSFCGQGFSAGDTWALLMNSNWRVGTYRFVGIFWLWLAFLPTGFVTTNKKVLAGVSVMAAIGITAVPLALKFAATPWYQTFGALTGLVTGYACRKLSAPE